jgi:hypothetical protein
MTAFDSTPLLLSARSAQSQSDVPDLANGQQPEKNLNKNHGIVVYEAFTKFLSNLYGWKP